MKTKKLIGLLTLTAILFIAIGGILPNANAEEINVLYVFDDPWYDQVDRFEEETGIEVNYIEAPFGDLRDRALSSFMAGEGSYDVIHVRDDWVAEFAERGFLTSLEQFLESEDIEGQAEYAVENLSRNGELYGMPRYIWLWQLYYNEEILEEAGIEEIPETWDEFYDVGETIAEETEYGAHVEALGTYHSTSGFIVRLLSEGGEFLDEDGKPAFNSEEGIRALEGMKEMYERGIVTDQSFELDGTGPTSDIFVQGDYAFTLNTPHLYPMSSDEEVSNVVGDVGVGLIPKGEAGSGSWAETAGVAIPSSSENKEAAYEYVKFVTSQEEQKEIALDLGRIPTRGDLLKDEELLEKYPHFEAVEEQIEHPFGMIDSPHGQEMLDITAEYIWMAMREGVDAETALTEAEYEILEILK